MSIIVDMNTLFVTNEVTGIYKLGGLGDVSMSLPKALQSSELDIRICMPYHPEIQLVQDTLVDSFYLSYAHRKQQIRIYASFIPNTTIPVYLVANDTYISKPTNAADNHADKYAVFSKAVAKWISQADFYWKPHLLHLNEWHSALIPVLCQHLYRPFPSLITLHNLLYQAQTTTPIHQHLGLEHNQCQSLSWQSQSNHINILFEGIIHANAITTVSPTYATEILSETHSGQIAPYFRDHQHKLSGILNGLDYTFFNPATDTHLYHPIRSATLSVDKAHNKSHFLKKYDLPSETILIGFIGRVDAEQKGIAQIIDLITQNAFPPSTAFVFLGTGDPHFETKLHQASQNSPNVRIFTRFDEPLAHQIYAASDYLLIPSDFEPCGLIQMIAMAYATIPIAHDVGGLHDTISHGVNGFLYQDNTTASIAQNISNIITKHHSGIDTLRSQAHATHFDWKQSADKYQDIYKKVLLN